MNTKEALLACADYLEEHGWWQGDACGPNEEMCSIGVIDEVAYGSTSNGLDGAALYDLMRGAMYVHLGLRTRRLDIPRWNDAPERTKEEVVAAFRGAAEALGSGS